MSILSFGKAYGRRDRAADLILRSGVFAAYPRIEVYVRMIRSNYPGANPNARSKRLA